MAFNDKICIWSGNQWICTRSPITSCGDPKFKDPYDSKVESASAREVERACSTIVREDTVKRRLLAEVAAIILASKDADGSLEAKREGVKRVMRLLLLRRVKADDDFLVVALDGRYRRAARRRTK
jgi:hypothetical protein